MVEEKYSHTLQKLKHEKESENASRFNSSKTHFSRKSVANLQSWIDVDLQPWKSTGISKKMVDLGAQQGMRASRIQIIDGKVYAQISMSLRGPS